MVRVLLHPQCGDTPQSSVGLPVATAVEPVADGSPLRAPGLDRRRTEQRGTLPRSSGWGLSPAVTRSVEDLRDGLRRPSFIACRDAP